MNSLKKFESPEIEIIKFCVEDILTTSNELPFTPYSLDDELEIARID